MKQSEIIEVFRCVVDMFDGIIAPNHEIVLHDLTRTGHTIEAIVNGHISNRTINSPLLTGPEDDQGFIGLLTPPDKKQKYRVIKGYQTTTNDGKVLHSASLICYDKARPIIALCVNADSEPTELLRRLQKLICLTAPDDHLHDNFSEPAEATINAIVARYGEIGRKLPRVKRRLVVTELHERGIFKLKGGVTTVSEALGVTRFTLYNDLEALGIK